MFFLHKKGFCSLGIVFLLPSQIKNLKALMTVIYLKYFGSRLSLFEWIFCLGFPGEKHFHSSSFVVITQYNSTRSSLFRNSSTTVYYTVLMGGLRCNVHEKGKKNTTKLNPEEIPSYRYLVLTHDHLMESTVSLFPLFLPPNFVSITVFLAAISI